MMTLALVYLPACIFSLVLLLIVGYLTTDIPSTVREFTQGGLHIWGSFWKLAGNERSKSDPKHRLLFHIYAMELLKIPIFQVLEGHCIHCSLFSNCIFDFENSILYLIDSEVKLFFHLLFPRLVISFETQSSLSKKSSNAQQVTPATWDLSLNTNKTKDSFMALWSCLWWWELLS